MIKCRKRPHTAAAVQWHGHNFTQVLALLESDECTASLHDSQTIIIRAGSGINTLRIGDYVVQGENGQIKTYTAAQFAVKYERV